MLPNAWRFFNSESFNVLDLKKVSCIYVAVYTYEFLEQGQLISAEIKKLQADADSYREKCEKELREKEERNRRHLLPKITCLYGAPLYGETANKEQLFDKSVKYLRSLNTIVGSVSEAKREVRMEVEEFNEGSIKRALDSAILYCLVHSERNYFFGEDNFGGI